MRPLGRNVALHFPVDGVAVQLDKKPTLAEAQQLVEGYVELINFTLDGRKAQALVNEDGLLKRMPPNMAASLLVGRSLVGPVIVLTGTRRWK